MCPEGLLLLVTGVMAVAQVNDDGRSLARNADGGPALSAWPSLAGFSGGAFDLLWVNVFGDATRDLRLTEHPRGRDSTGQPPITAAPSERQ
jgi:hypothetical protein